MSRISPKPMMMQTIRRWDVQPGMTYAVTEDTDGRLWIEESCPVGTHYWTVEQAAELPGGFRTQHALQEAVSLAWERLSLDQLPTLPVFRAASDTVSRRSGSQGRDRRLAGV